MEYSPQLDQLDDHSPVASTSGSRKRPAPDDSPSAEAKRAKARERQRRKRERDRAGMVAAYDANGAPQAEYGARAQQQPDEELTPEQLAKKERLKKAARERQRKHRAVVKAKRMAEMGLAMAVEGQLPAAGYHDAAAYAAAVHMHAQQHPDLHDDDPDAQLQHPDLPEQQPDASPGQTFASLVLLSFSCAPLLKQHLLRTLNMTSDELQSFGPILAASWERWNHDASSLQRFMFPTTDPDACSEPCNIRTTRTTARTRLTCTRTTQSCPRRTRRTGNNCTPSPHPTTVSATSACRTDTRPITIQSTLH